MMSQTYNEDVCFNPSKLLLLQFIAKEGIIADYYLIRDFQRYLYRVYSDNPDVASKHPSYVVRKIHTYGVDDLEELANDTLTLWVRDSSNNVLRVGKRKFSLDFEFDEDREDIAKNTFRFAKMMYQRVFKGDIPDVVDVWDEKILKNDHDIDLFGKSHYKYRVLEDLQYCPICEQIGEDNLFAVHILEARMGAKDNMLFDQNNGLVFCQKHALQYINNAFYYDELGFAHNIKESDVEPGMHLSFSVRNSSRKEYLIYRKKWLKDNGYL